MHGRDRTVNRIDKDEGLDVHGRGKEDWDPARYPGDSVLTVRDEGTHYDPY